MKFEDISVPDIYKQSQDFRFFLHWFNLSLSAIKYDTENLLDLYDCLKCPENLLWMLADTIGYKYDDRVCAAFNRLVMLYFMSMIRNRGSKDGLTLAAEVNLAQFDINMKAEGYTDESGNNIPGNDILYNRLENTSVPVNSAYVTPHTSEGYIDVVYFSTKLPTDVCTEYVRPVGMYMFQSVGVRVDARTRISVDARLTNINDTGISIGSTRVGHYRRSDYATLQKMRSEESQVVNDNDTRNPVYYRNSVAEKDTNSNINPGYRALYSLQMCNNEQIVKALIDPVFSLGYGPQTDSDRYSDEPMYITENNVRVENPKSYLVPLYKDKPIWNLRYDRAQEESLGSDVYTIDSDRTSGVTSPRPAVNPIMGELGDAMIDS